ncbi:MAG: hypothetical protein R3F44_00390 [Candidatus Competibacteraceae bacterium]
MSGWSQKMHQGGSRYSIKMGLAGNAPVILKRVFGGYCSSWLYNRLWWAGIIYRGLCFFYQIADALPMWVRECSPTKGGDAVGHASHETGIDMDMRLPLLPPDTDKRDDSVAMVTK